ncbi:MAG TPA: MFS transporter [Actinocrinis sp.]|jgi:predicted MFS family arabinose efflux permease
MRTLRLEAAHVPRVRQLEAARAVRRDERDFHRLWAGDAVSQLGSQITLLALPLAAVVTLHASGGQVGLLQTLYTLSFLMVPLPAGVWLEHRTRRPVLVATNLVCAALVVSLPLAAALGRLGMAQLYAVAALGGAATVISDVGKFTLVPELVGTDRLAVSNSKLNAGLAVGATAGPGLAGWLTAWIGAPNALLADGFSYLVCAGAVASLRHRETLRDASPAAAGRNLRGEVVAGLRTVFATPPVRCIGIFGAIYNSGLQMVSIALIVLVVRDLGFGSAAFGAIMVFGGVGAVMGTVLAPSLIRAVGHGPALLGTLLLSVQAFWLLPLAHGGRLAMVAWCSVALLAGSAGSSVAGVVATTVRLLLTPPELHARMNASYRLLTFGTIPVGALAGGLLVQWVGAHTVLWIAAAVLVASVSLLAQRPVRSLGRVLIQATPVPST